MSEQLTHLTSNGEVHMVDVGAKAVTKRTATASGELLMQAATLDLVLSGSSPKGDVFAVTTRGWCQMSRGRGNRRLLKLFGPVI